MAHTRVLIALALAGALACWSLPAARAQDTAGLFQVSRIPVDASAADAVAAREQALVQGQVEGLRRLLRRLTPADAYGRLPVVGPAEIERYVQNFEIAEEQVASNRYLAQLTVGYQPDAVRELLQDHGLSYAEMVSEPVVILPVYRTSAGPQLWPENNPWWQAWAEHLDSERLLRLVLPLGDLQDMAAVTPDRAMAGDIDGLAALGQRYGSNEVLVVVATPGAALRPPLPGQPPQPPHRRRSSSKCVGAGSGRQIPPRLSWRPPGRRSTSSWPTRSSASRTAWTDSGRAPISCATTSARSWWWTYRLPSCRTGWRSVGGSMASPRSRTSRSRRSPGIRCAPRLVILAIRSASRRRWGGSAWRYREKGNHGGCYPRAQGPAQASRRA